jgi:hypothetical protein
MIAKQKLLPLLLLFSIYANGQEKLGVRNLSYSPCEKSHFFADLHKQEGRTLLSAYGYNIEKELWECTKIESPWLKGVTLLQFDKISAQVDDFLTFSAMKIAGMEHIWVIPTVRGMLQYPRLESDPHNIAAFNTLLHSIPKAPASATEWVEIGKLYMAILVEKNVEPITSKLGERDPCSSEIEYSLSFSSGPVLNDEPYNKWTLAFSCPSPKNTPRLIDVVSKTVGSSADE